MEPGEWGCGGWHYRIATEDGLMFGEFRRARREAGRELTEEERRTITETVAANGKHYIGQPLVFGFCHRYRDKVEKEIQAEAARKPASDHRKWYDG